MQMRKLQVALLGVAGLISLAAPAIAQQEGQGQGKAIVTIEPRHEGQAVPPVTTQTLTLKVNGKPSAITTWTPLRNETSPIEMVVLIDGAARSSLGSQLTDIAHFLEALPPNARAAVAYMQNGRAVFTGPLTTDHAAAARTLRLPAGPPGISASPYFCLSDLAMHWPSSDPQARREVVMITDGVDPYEPRYDPENVHVDSAMNDAARAGLVVYSIYWTNGGRADASMYAANTGQSLLAQTTDATGGFSYWQGLGNPVSLEPFFRDINRRLGNQYELRFVAQLTHKPEVESMSLKLTAPDARIDAPDHVYVGRPAVSGE